MNQLARQTVLPAPPAGVELSFRVATLNDFDAIDALQKKYDRQLGFFRRAQMEGYLENGWILIAEDPAKRAMLGYCVSRDRYLKRDELGVVYQLCVTPGVQRKFVGAALVREVFHRSAYGCRLYCCWCAQDLEANRFWESIGFVPVAFRAGSDKKKRVHIFWQKRIVDGDVTTPYWYPSQTNAGALRADRLVFPIPPGTHWTEVQAVTVPVIATGEEPAEALKRSAPKPRIKAGTHDPAKGPRLMKQAQFIPPGRKPTTFETAPVPASVPEVVQEPADAKPLKASSKKGTSKIDPKFLAANRELRDRYLEQLNTHDVAGQGKYDVSRCIAGTSAAQSIAPAQTVALLPQAA